MTGRFPEYRPRRLRGSAAMRALVRETELSARQLILPLFARGGKKVRQPIGSMPGCFQLSIDELVKECEGAVARCLALIELLEMQALLARHAMPGSQGVH